ncbi:hypothetical protein F2Q68_00024974 [Brassica cretica]|uniref:Uncharacterized protein n=1 Tax=Brassica cretica TaxID=69181 RepID=A0A8S9IFE4_BRACR|nr:hypothetical protein F2Q68_00024974 [Brassica cretica]
MLTLLKGILGDAEEKEYTLGDAHSSRKELTRCLGKRDEAWAMLILLKGILELEESLAMLGEERGGLGDDAHSSPLLLNDVYEINGDLEFMTCDPTSPIAVHKTGHDLVKLTEP